MYISKCIMKVILFTYVDSSWLSQRAKKVHVKESLLVKNMNLGCQYKPLKVCESSLTMKDSAETFQFGCGSTAQMSERLNFIK